ncbi:MAG TPA: amino acid permease [Alphaproteobacteria bacterium]|jgi:APA family basic amino acid/polyamine antiporter|nr:amino acid permease [Alphaproteobacteria bacterium]
MPQKSLFAVKPFEQVIADGDEGDYKLKRVLGPVNLVALGIGAIIGAGLFSLTGVAAGENAGPAVVLSFIIAAIGCGLAGLCYSELAAMIPVSGSAYTYAQATLGQFVAWIIGWDLVLEYAIGAATVSVSWSRHLVELFDSLGIKLATVIPIAGVNVNFGAIAVIVAISLLLMRGIGESARVNMAIVIIKVAIVIAVIVVGAFFVNTANYVPFIPENTGSFGEFGISGIFRAAGIIFFAYIGFDAISTTSQEAKNPQKDMVWGIMGSLVICTLLYIAFSLVLVGMVNYQALKGDSAPTATAIDMTPFPILKVLVKFGIVAGQTSVILVMLLGQSRVFRAMSADRLLPKFFSDIHPTWRTPWRSNLLFMVFVSLFAGFIPISILGEMTSIGTLLAFIIVCIGVMVLRRTRPELDRPFRTPWVPFIPIAGIVVCLAMMVSLGVETWIRLVIWLAIGFAVYFFYSRRHAGEPLPQAAE